MTLLEAIDLRRSRRRFLAVSVDKDKAEKLHSLAQEYSRIDGIRFELIFNNGDAFNGLRRSYGLFSGVNNYALLLGRQNDFTVMEQLGYYGELFTLHAVAMGLDTCWVGGSFSRVLCPVTLSDNEIIYCAIVFGSTAAQLSMKEKLIYKFVHRKTKSLEEMITGDAPYPDWFLNGIRAVQKAPSALNRQPVLFSCKEGAARAGINNMRDIGSVIDMGIAKLHFELGARNGKWNPGNFAEFVLDAAEQ